MLVKFILFKFIVLVEVGCLDFGYCLLVLIDWKFEKLVNNKVRWIFMYFDYL